MSFLVIQMFIFLMIFCLFYFLYFNFGRSIGPSSHGTKIRHDQLTISGPEANWFWQRVDGLRFSPSLRLGIPPSAVDSSPPCWRDDIRRPTTSICMLGRWPSHLMVWHVFYTSLSEGGSYTTTILVASWVLSWCWAGFNREGSLGGDEHTVGVRILVFLTWRSRMIDSLIGAIS